MPACSNDGDIEQINAGTFHDGANWMVSAECQNCFEDASDNDETAACTACTPPTVGCVCTVAEIMSLGDDAGVSAGCWSCAAAAGENTGSVCGGATCGDDCTCSAADIAILSAEEDACSASRDSCVSASCMACITTSHNAGGDGSNCYNSWNCRRDTDCSNGGSCANGVCTCYPGFSGVHCEDEEAPCAVDGLLDVSASGACGIEGVQDADFCHSSCYRVLGPYMQRCASSLPFYATYPLSAVIGLIAGCDEERQRQLAGIHEVGGLVGGAIASGSEAGDGECNVLNVPGCSGDIFGDEGIPLEQRCSNTCMLEVRFSGAPIHIAFYDALP
eukprot:SAG11_NODE_550_length_8588_cov_9.354105_1_plen_331_part_00